MTTRCSYERPSRASKEAMHRISALAVMILGGTLVAACSSPGGTGGVSGTGGNGATGGSASGGSTATGGNVGAGGIWWNHQYDRNRGECQRRDRRSGGARRQERRRGQCQRHGRQRWYGRSRDGYGRFAEHRRLHRRAGFCRRDWKIHGDLRAPGLDVRRYARRTCIGRHDDVGVGRGRAVSRDDLQLLQCRHPKRKDPRLRPASGGGVRRDQSGVRQQHSKFPGALDGADDVLSSGAPGYRVRAVHDVGAHGRQPLDLLRRKRERVHRLGCVALHERADDADWIRRHHRRDRLQDRHTAGGIRADRGPGRRHGDQPDATTIGAPRCASWAAKSRFPTTPRRISRSSVTGPTTTRPITTRPRAAPTTRRR